MQLQYPIFKNDNITYIIFNLNKNNFKLYNF